MSPQARAARATASAVLLLWLVLPLAGCLDPGDDDAKGGAAAGVRSDGDAVVEGNRTAPGLDTTVDTPDADVEMDVAPRGVASVDLVADVGVTVRLTDAGWARVAVTAASAATFHVHATRPTPNGPISVLDDDAAGMGPNDYLSISVFVADDGGAYVPMYDLLVWGFSEELRTKTGAQESMIGFLNPGDVSVGPDKPGVLVVSTSLDGVEVGLVPEGDETAADTLAVRPIVHPALVARYAAHGEHTYTGASTVATVEDREVFTDVEADTMGMDGVIVWQSGEGTARYGKMDHEMGHRTEEGDCAHAGGAQDLFVDAGDPTGPTPAVTWGASTGWTDEPRARSLCAAVSAQMVGGWERTGSGAWFFHAPFEAPAGF